MLWIFWIFCAYIIGSIPFGVLIAQMNGVDIMQAGSGNPGATNVGRVLGRRFGLLCFGLDVVKGVLPVIASGLAMLVFGRDPAAIATSDQWGWLAVAAATVVGHSASPFLGFRGGKGVATSLGALLALWPLLSFPVLFAFGIWIGVVLATRIVSLASILAACALPMGSVLWIVIGRSTGFIADGPIVNLAPPFIVACVLTALVVLRHRANIARLRNGGENRVGSNANSPTTVQPDAH